MHDFRAVFEVIQQILLGGVDDLQLDVFAEVGAIHQQLEAAPGGFQRLELGVVEDFVHLPAELGVDLRDHAVDHGLFYWLIFVLRLQQLFDKGRYTALGDVIGFVVRSQFGLGNDAVEDAEVGGAATALYCCTSAHELASLLIESGVQLALGSQAEFAEYAVTRIVISQHAFDRLAEGRGVTQWAF